MKNAKYAILFDLDGTLWDSSEAVVDSWNEVIDTLPDFTRRITMEDMQGLMGKTMEDIAYTYFDTVSRPRALEIMKACTDYENEYIRMHGGILFPKLEETLSVLSEEYFLAIVSNCQCGYIEAFLDHHGLGKYFDDKLCYGDTLTVKGETIKKLLAANGFDATNSCYVGDTFGDFTATKYAGLPFVLADYGFGEAPDADYVLDTFENLPKLMKQVVS